MEPSCGHRYVVPRIRSIVAPRMTRHMFRHVSQVLVNLQAPMLLIAVMFQRELFRELNKLAHFTTHVIANPAIE
jgi:hypothetical protein